MLVTLLSHIAGKTVNQSNHLENLFFLCTKAKCTLYALAQNTTPCYSFIFSKFKYSKIKLLGCAM